MNKVKVKLGWKRTQDGHIPKIGKPGPDMRERPGDYLFHDVINPGSGPDVKFVFVDREEEIYATPGVCISIMEGHLLVVDPEHSWYPLNQPEPTKPEPEKAPEETKPKKSRGKKKTPKPKE
jgi:hypothetical protein